VAKTEGEQFVPSEFAYLYEGTLQYSKLPWRYVGHRFPWIMGGKKAVMGKTTYKQRLQRAIFKDAVECYNCQPATGGITPPGRGPRNRSWWFNDAVGSGLWYYDYFIQQTINRIISGNTVYWCSAAFDGFQHVDSQHPDTVYSRYDYALVENHLGRERWIYIMKKDFPFPNLSCWVQVILGDYPYIGELIFEIYETLAVWNKTTLTWNNKPAEGELLSTYTFWAENNYGLIKIPLPTNKQLMCLKVKAGGTIWGMWINKGNPAVPIPAPYMVP